MVMESKYVSDELLAAFWDGNTTREETELVLEAMGWDDNLTEFADIANDVISFEDKMAVWKGDYGYWELGIDPVLKPEEVLADASLEEESLLINSDSNDDDLWMQSNNLDVNDNGIENTNDFDSELNDDSLLDF
jgi:hypothetical protein